MEKQKRETHSRQSIKHVEKILSSFRTSIYIYIFIVIRDESIILMREKKRVTSRGLDSI